ncbi:MAG: oligopeptidase A [Gammaproteobacteria bacterium]|nr:oligopeptidase A [Gammaproteobacteria bacterium]
MAKNTENPLLDTDTLPAFSRIRPQHVEPAIERLLGECRDAIVAVETAGGTDWDSVVAPLEECDDRLNKAWSPVSHLHSVADNPELRQAYNACLPKLSEYATDFGQNEKLYAAFERLSEGDGFSALDQAQKRVVENSLKDFRFAGVHLEAEKKARFKQVSSRLSELASTFEENVLDATQAWKKHLPDKSALAGLPETALAVARDAAKRAGLEGWLVNLEFPSYLAVMTYADDGDLRREVYEAYCTRASDQGPYAGRWDNTQVMQEILALRAEMATLLGYENYAELSIERKMVKSCDEVLGFLNDLAARALPVARKELEELRRFAGDNGHEGKLEPWDVGYYAEKLKRERFSVSQEELRPYFAADRAVQGLFEVSGRLYGVSIEEKSGVDVWHPDVRFFEIRDDSGQVRGAFYLDLFARGGKRGGAWMDECRVRRRSAGGLQLPVAYLTCNFTPPVDGVPSLLTHEELLTLFHEFGHGLHHLLTRVERAGVSGINGVEWDAVELPSQFLEHWCWEWDALAPFARHHESGEPLPRDLFDRMRAAKNFQAGMAMVRQLEFALFDFRLHREFDGQEGFIQRILKEVREQVAVIRPPSFNRFPNGFSHIFAGGYAAGYYSYKWAEVLSCDAFSKFEENGIFDRETGRAFLSEILERGGTRDALESFVAFLGREPSNDALLRHSGIDAAQSAVESAA